MRRNRQRGFTLIELMMAVAIMALLTAVAVPLYRGYIGEARIGTAITDIRQIEVVLNDLAMDNNLAALDDNEADPRGVYLLNSVIELDDPGAPPAGAQPYLDPWNTMYRYRRPGTHTDSGGNLSNDGGSVQGYDLWSAGPDGVFGNGDDVVRGCNGDYAGFADDHPAC